MPELSYRTTEDLEVRANQQHFRVILGKRWLGMVVLLVMGLVLVFLPGPQLYRYLAAFSWAALVCLLALWWKTYSFLVGTARSSFAQLQDPTVHVRWDEEGFEWSCDIGSRKTRWSEVDRRVETEDFHLLYSGRMPVASVPKAHLNAETEAFLLAKFP